jgi:hypothetical protein
VLDNVNPYITIVCDEKQFYYEVTLREIDSVIKKRLKSEFGIESKDLQKIIALFTLILQFIVFKNPSTLYPMYFDLCNLTDKLEMKKVEEYREILEKYLPPKEGSI